MSKTYQNCNIFEKIWRRRWYLMIPVWTLKLKYTTDISLEYAWKLSVGIAQLEMNWCYDIDEVFSRLKTKFEYFDSVKQENYEK